MSRLGRIARRVWSGRFGARRVLPASEAYALWAETYPPWPHNPLMEVEQAVVAPIILSTTPMRALDVGTGSGRYLPLLASTGARLVVGVDCSLPMLTATVRLKPDATGGEADFNDVRGVRLQADHVGPEPDVTKGIASVHRVCADACRLPFDAASFDLAVSGLALNFVPDAAIALSDSRFSVQTAPRAR